MNKELINLSNLQRFLSKLNEKFALKKTMKGITEDSEGNIIIGEEGLVPTPDENSKGKFLRSDGEWALPSETTVYDSMTIEEGVAGVSKVDRVLNAKNLKQIVNSDGFLTSLDSSKLTGIINIENLPQGALERILIVSSKEERLTLLDTEVQLGDVVKEVDTGLMYYVINTEKLNSEEGYTQFTAGSASSVPWSGVTDKPTIPTKTSDLTNDSDFAIDSGVVHKTGDETINGTKTFNNDVTVCGDLYDKNVQADLTQIPTSNNYTQYRFVDKNSKTMGYVQHVQRTTGINQLTFIVKDSNNVDHGFFVTTNKELLPAGNNTYSLGGSANKWAKVYSDDVVHTSGNETIGGTKTFSSKIVGNLQGNADTATSSIKATQDSAGQQINKTYIKELSVSGRTITYKRGDNTTGTITTQDTNTTYSKLSQFTNDTGFITSSGSCKFATSAGSAGNGVDSYGEGWIRFKNGIQMCWGRGRHEETISYSKAFISDPMLNCTAASNTLHSLVVNFYQKTSTQFACRLWNVQTSAWHTSIGFDFDWIAIGLWK